MTGGTLAAGETVEGWLTFGLPIGVNELNVTYTDGIFGEAHEWSIPYDAAAGPVVVATPMPTPRIPGTGFTYCDRDLAVTLVRVDWNASGPILKADPEDQWVGILVRYRARQTADFSPSDWRAVDDEGFEANQPIFTHLEPELDGGRLRRGGTVEGWVTLEFPRGVRTIEVTYTADPDGEPHVWRVRRG